ncbi:hypothetical protein EHI44_33280 [Rhizobium leguminosarum]|nr:hypothetical protein EHI44_33280 [Rhizobium leguminosarum]
MWPPIGEIPKNSFANFAARISQMAAYKSLLTVAEARRPRHSTAPLRRTFAKLARKPESEGTTMVPRGYTPADRPDVSWSRTVWQYR